MPTLSTTLDIFFRHVGAAIYLIILVSLFIAVCRESYYQFKHRKDKDND